MKKLILMVAALFAACVSMAQISETTTPELGSVYRAEWSLSGKQYALKDFTVYEAHVRLPFGLDFKAGHGPTAGVELLPSATVTDTTVFGWEVYFRKDIGGDGGFLKVSARALTGQGKKPDWSVGASLGYQFK